MSCTKEPWLLNKHLNNQLNETKVRVQDSLTGLRYTTYKPYSNVIAWNFIKNNWNQLIQRLSFCCEIL